MEEKIKENVKEDANKSSQNIASLVLGIISTVTFMLWFITMPTGILAIVFGAKSIKKTGSNLAKTGLILGIIGLSLFAALYIFMITSLIYEHFFY